MFNVTGFYSIKHGSELMCDNNESHAFFQQFYIKLLSNKIISIDAITNVTIILQDSVLFWRIEECHQEACYCFLATKFSVSGWMWEVATWRQLSNLSLLSRFPALLFSTFIFKNSS